MSDSRRSNLALLAVAALFQAAPLGLAQGTPPQATASRATAPAIPDEPVAQGAQRPARLSVIPNPSLDRSGKKRIGKASFYADMFAGKKMADGNPMNPHENNAASRTLPLGTTAKVTNLETGKSAVVTIQDRGPYVVGRIVDLSPATAQQIGITPRKGVAKVEVAPITVPLQNGRVKFGDAADIWLLAGNREYPVFPIAGR